MDILKKSIAPITDIAWVRISEQLSEILEIHLTARNFVDIDGPNGLELGSISTGRLIVSDEESHTGINYGIREVLPLIEIRKPFELDLWELDNINRGAKDPALSTLVEAAKEVVLFEENAIYYGFTPAGIKGLEQVYEGEPVSIPANANEALKVIAKQVVDLKKNAVEGPYSLIITTSDWLNMIELSQGYPVHKQLEEILGGKVIINQSNENTFLVSERGGDYELVLGQDITLGYDAHDTKSVKLYLTSSFTFRVITPEAVVVFGSSNE